MAVMEKFTRMEVGLHLSAADYPRYCYREGAMVMARRAAMRSSNGGWVLNSEERVVPLKSG